MIKPAKLFLILLLKCSPLEKCRLEILVELPTECMN